MCPSSIPIQLTLAEICVAALTEAADGIEEARDMAAFLDALDINHRLWLAMREVGPPEARDTEFAIARSSRLGRGVNDAEVEALVAINRRLAEELAANGAIGRIRTRVRLAYREDGGGGFVPWLLTQMNKKGRLRSLFIRTAERGASRPATEPASA